MYPVFPLLPAHHPSLFGTPLSQSLRLSKNEDEMSLLLLGNCKELYSGSQRGRPAICSSSHVRSQEVSGQRQNMLGQALAGTMAASSPQTGRAPFCSPSHHSLQTQRTSIHVGCRKHSHSGTVPDAWFFESLHTEWKNTGKTFHQVPFELSRH